MPEFRFRRKKQREERRRHTLHDTEETKTHVEAALAQTESREDTFNTFKPQLLPSSSSHPHISQYHNSQAHTSPSPLPEPIPISTSSEKECVSTGTLAREREKFFDLLRSKYPEQSKGIEEWMSNGTERKKVGHGHRRSVSADEDLIAQERKEEGEEEREGEEEEENGGREHLSLSPEQPKKRSSQRYGGNFFLRQGRELRRCPLPSPITLSTLKNLFVNTFDLRLSLRDDPHCHVMIQDKLTHKWKALKDISEVFNNCVLQLVDPMTSAISDHTLPISGSQPSLKDTAGSPGLRFTSGSCDHLQPNIEEGMDFNGLWRSDKLGLNLQDLSTLPDSFSLHRAHSHHSDYTPQPSSLTSTGAQYGSPYSVESSTSGVGSDSLHWLHSQHKVVRQVHSLQKSAHELKEEYEVCRREQLAQMAEFSLTLRNTSLRIAAAMRHHRQLTAVSVIEDVDQQKRERIELCVDKDAYGKQSNDVILETNILETAVEGIRRDVVERRCQVVGNEVERLIAAVQFNRQALNYTRDQYTPLERKLKRVMEHELRTIVEEEQFLQEESPRLKECQDKCHELLATLETLQQLATIQFHRTPRVPIFRPVYNPNRHAVMESIKAVTPNHMHRMECIEMAECVHRKKREMSREKDDIKQFEAQLQVQKEHLHKMGYASQVQGEQEKKTRALYMDEKKRQKKELMRELEWEKKVAEKKKEEERQRLKERLALKKKQKKEKQKMEQTEDQRQKSSNTTKIDQSTESVADTEEDTDSLLLTSSMSSTASMLEYVMSIGESTSDKQPLAPHHQLYTDDPILFADQLDFRSREGSTPRADEDGVLVNFSSLASEDHVKSHGADSRRTFTKLHNADASKVKSSDASKVKLSDASKIKLPDTDKAKLFDASKVKIPDVSKVKSTDTGKNKSPDARKVKSPDARKVKSPDARKVKSPDARKVKSPDASEVKLPDTGKVKLSDGSKVKSTDAGKLKLTDARKIKSADARKVKSPDADSSKAVISSQPATGSKTAARSHDVHDAKAIKRSRDVDGSEAAVRLSHSPNYARRVESPRGAEKRMPLVNETRQANSKHLQLQHLNQAGSMISPTHNITTHNQPDTETKTTKNVHHSLKSQTPQITDKPNLNQNKQHPIQHDAVPLKETSGANQDHSPTSQQESSGSKEKQAQLKEKRQINSQNEPAWGKFDFGKYTQVNVSRNKGQGTQLGQPALKSDLKTTRSYPSQEKSPTHRAKSTDRAFKTTHGQPIFSMQEKQQQSIQLGHKPVKHNHPHDKPLSGKAFPPNGALQSSNATHHSVPQQRAPRAIQSQQQVISTKQPSQQNIPDAPPRARKSFGYQGEFDDNAGFYDLLDAKVSLSQPQPYFKSFAMSQVPNPTALNGAPMKMKKQVPQQSNHIQHNLNTIQSVDTTAKPASSRQYTKQYSHSQPDSFDLSSNPAYDTATVGILQGRGEKVGLQAVKRRPAPKRPENVRKSVDDAVLTQHTHVNMKRQHPNTHVHQQHLPMQQHHQPQLQHPNARIKGSNSTSNQHPISQFSRSKPPTSSYSQQQILHTQFNPKSYAGPGYSKNVADSGSDVSSDTHSRLCHGSTSGNHSTTSGVSSGQSVSSVQPTPMSPSNNHSSYIPPSQAMSAPSSQAHSSGLPAPRTRCHSQPQSSYPQSSHGPGTGAPPHAHTAYGNQKAIAASQLPVHQYLVHEERVLTSYPRFHRKPHAAGKMKDGRPPNTRPYPGSPGIGHGNHHHKMQDHSNTSHSAHQNVGSLV